MKIIFKTLSGITLFVLFYLGSGTAIAGGDAEEGKKKSVACAACHGADGISTVAIYPNLAGQKEQYLVSAIKAYKKDGSRTNPIMGPMVAPLSDDDIANLATFYANITSE